MVIGMRKVLLMIICIFTSFLFGCEKKNRITIKSFDGVNKIEFGKIKVKNYNEYYNGLSYYITFDTNEDFYDILKSNTSFSNELSFEDNGKKWGYLCNNNRLYRYEINNSHVTIKQMDSIVYYNETSYYFILTDLLQEKEDNTYTFYDWDDKKIGFETIKEIYSHFSDDFYTLYEDRIEASLINPITNETSTSTYCEITNDESGVVFKMVSKY